MIEPRPAAQPGHSASFLNRVRHRLAFDSFPGRMIALTFLGSVDDPRTEAVLQTLAATSVSKRPAKSPSSLSSLGGQEGCARDTISISPVPVARASPSPSGLPEPLSSSIPCYGSGVSRRVLRRPGPAAALRPLCRPLRARGG
jgi:hypothetical protein